MLSRNISLMVCCLLATPAYGGDPPEKLQAAFIFQFTKYIEWQAQGIDRKFEINVPDDVVLYGILSKELLDKKVKDAPVLVDNSFANTRAQIHVIADPWNKKSEALVRSLGNCECLIIGLNRDMAEATIRLIREGNTFRFYINQEAAKRQKLYISSRLLKLAKSDEGA